MIFWQVKFHPPNCHNLPISATTRLLSNNASAEHVVPVQFGAGWKSSFFAACKLHRANTVVTPYRASFIDN
jgi:hypothetical protein